MQWKTDTWYVTYHGWLHWVFSPCPSRNTLYPPPLHFVPWLPCPPLLVEMSKARHLRRYRGRRENRQDISSLHSLTTKFPPWSTQLLPPGPLHTSFSSDSGNSPLLSPSVLALGYWTLLLFLNSSHSSVISPYWNAPSASYQNPTWYIDLNYNCGCSGFN